MLTNGLDLSGTLMVVIEDFVFAYQLWWELAPTFAKVIWLNGRRNKLGQQCPMEGMRSGARVRSGVPDHGKTRHAEGCRCCASSRVLNDQLS